MLSVTCAMLLACPFLMLRLSGGSFPRPLTQKEESEYLSRCMAGDIDARNVLIERNLRLVAHIIKKYYTQAEDQDDLISIGTIGLIKGVTSYKPDKGVRLATYASRCIENEILMYFRSIKKTSGEISLSETIESGDGDGLSLMDVISSDSDMFEDVSRDELCGKVVQYIDGVLDDREKRIIGMRYGIGGVKPMTQREIASALCISRSYVSRRRYCKI